MILSKEKTMAENSVNKTKKIEWMSEKEFLRKVWSEQECSWNKEQVETLTWSYLSDKEERINQMYSNIVHKNISWDKIKWETISLKNIQKYRTREEMPMVLQDAIMRRLVARIIENLEWKKKEEFEEKFRYIIDGQNPIGIKTLEEFLPYTKNIDEKKLEIPNDDIVWFLQLNKVIQANPLTKIEEWSIFDRSILLEMLYLWNKEFYEVTQNAEKESLEEMRELLKMPKLNQNFDTKLQNEIEKKIVEHMNEADWLEQELSEFRNSEVKGEYEEESHYTDMIEDNKTKKEILEDIQSRTRNIKDQKQRKEFIKDIEKKWWNDDIKKIIKEIDDSIKEEDAIWEYVSKAEKSEIVKKLGINTNELNRYMRSLEDLGDKKETIFIKSRSGKKFNFASSKREIKDNQWHKKIEIKIDFNDTDPEILNRLENPKNDMTSEEENKDGIFYSLFAKNGEVRIADGYEIKIDDKYEWFLDYSLDETDFDEWELEKEYPEIMEKDENWNTTINHGVAFLCKRSGEVIKDENGKYIYVFEWNVESKKVEIIDRKIKVSQEKMDLMTKLFYAWNTKKEWMDGIKSWLNGDKKESTEDRNKELDEIIKDNWKINIWEPSHNDVEINSNLGDEERKQKAKELLEKTAKENNIESKWFEDGLLELVLFAHYSTQIGEEEYKKLTKSEQEKYKKIWENYYEIWKDWNKIAGVYFNEANYESNYSTNQLKEKIKILKSTNWFEDWQVKALLKYGICGINPNSIEDKQKWIEKAKEWIDDNVWHYEDDYIDEEYAIPEAENEYKELWSDGRKTFIETLKKEKSWIEEVDDLKNKVANYLTENKDRLEKETEKNNEEEWKEWEEKKETKEEKFDRAWESIDGDKCRLEAWIRLFTDIWWSKLPPDDVEASWLELEIVWISTVDFTVKVIGCDIKTDLDGQTFRLPKTEEQINKMKASGPLHKMPKSNRKDWNDCFEKIEKSEIFDNITVFGTWHNQVQMKKGKLINGNGEEIKYFCRTVNTYEVKEEKWWVWKDAMGQTAVVVTYEAHPTKNGKVKVKCNFTWQDPKDFSKDAKFKHEREMDYTSFMLLMESKQVMWYTEKQKGDTPPTTTWSRDPMKGKKFRGFSIMSIIDTVKWMKKNVDDKVDEYRKEQKEDFEHLLCSYEWLDLYGKMGNVFGLLGPNVFTGLQDAMSSAWLEYYAERENRTWKKIEKRYNLFEKDPHFSTQWWQKLMPILLEKGSFKNRYQFAAAFLYTIKKDGPWNRVLYEKMGQWFWVEKFLWPEHAKRFLEMQKKRKTELEEYKKLNIVHRRQPRHSELSRLEFDYLVGVIDGRQPFGWFKDDDEHYQASKWSRTFAEKLKENTDEYFGWFEEKYKKIWRISFRQAEQEWFRHMRNIRPHKALPFLKAMAVNAQSRAEEDRVKAAILGAMLSWVFKNMQDHNLRSEFWRISRAMWFLPWLWCRDTEQQENTLKLLDTITSNPPFEKKFSEETKYDINNFQIDNFTDKQSHFLIHTFPRYWKANGEKILKILQFQDRESKNSVINLAQTWPNKEVFKYLLEKSREYIREDIDEEVAGTYWFYEHSPLTANKWVISKVMPSNGKFEQTDNNMREWAQLFWREAGKNDENMIPTKAVSKWSVEFIFGKYFNWLEDAALNQSLAFFVRWLSLVKKLKSEWRHKEANYYLWYVVYGNVMSRLRWFPAEFDTAMKRFLKFFENNIDKIDANMVGTICNSTEAIGYFKNPYEALDLKEFWEKYMSQTTGGTKSKYKNEHGKNPDKHINWQIETLFNDIKKLSNGGQPDMEEVIESI